MVAHSKAMSAFFLTLLLTLHSWPGRTRARPLPSAQAVSGKSSSSETLDGLQPDEKAVKGLGNAKKDTSKQVAPSLRRIPPSRANPIQNKCKPP